MSNVGYFDVYHSDIVWSIP